MSLYVSCLERFLHPHSSLSSSSWIKIRSRTFPSPSGTTYKPSLILCASAIHITPLRRLFISRVTITLRKEKRKVYVLFASRRFTQMGMIKRKERGNVATGATPLFLFSLRYNLVREYIAYFAFSSICVSSVYCASVILLVA